MSEIRRYEDVSPSVPLDIPWSSPWTRGELWGGKRFHPLSEAQRRNGDRKQRLLQQVTYLIGAEGTHLVKIGHTTMTPEKRLAALQTGQPMQLSLLWSMRGAYEKPLHQRFAAYRVRGEWFDLTPFGEDPVKTVQQAIREIRDNGSRRSD